MSYRDKLTLIKHSYKESNKFFSHLWTNLATSHISINENTKDVRKMVQSFSIIVPDHLCNRSSKMTPSALIAIFDEFSSLNIMCQDRNSRPGVSIQLSTEIIEDCGSGDEIIMTTEVAKIGKYLGFCSMEVRNVASNTLIAKGKHVKFMQHGVVWDILFNSTLLPWLNSAIQFMENSKYGVIISNQFMKLLSIKLRDPPIFPNIKGLTGVFREMKIKKVENVDAVGHFNDCYELNVQPFMTNYFGALHGGALSMAIEETCHLYRIQQLSGEQPHDGSLDIQSIVVRYLSPMSGKLHIYVADVSSSKYAMIYKHSNNAEIILSKKTVGRIIKNGQLCAEFDAMWS